MNNHTPEPWEKSERANGNWWHISAGNQAIAAVHAASKKRNEPYASMFEENARRIVACVNACRGIGTDGLEQHGLVSLLATQRDELLAALQRLISSDPHVEMFPTSELEICANNEALTPTLREQAASVIQARAVIAMVKGGAS